MELAHECYKKRSSVPSLLSHNISCIGKTTMNTSERSEKPRPRTLIEENDPLIDGLNNLTVSFKNLVESTSQAEASLRTKNKRLREERDSLRNERHSLRTERDSLRSERNSLRTERDNMRQERDSLRDGKNRMSTDNELLRREVEDRPIYGNIKKTASNTATVGRGDKRKTGRGHRKST